MVVISSKDSMQHQGVALTMEGAVNLQLSAKSVGVFEAFYNSVKVRCARGVFLRPGYLQGTLIPILWGLTVNLKMFTYLFLNSSWCGVCLFPSLLNMQG